MKQYVQNWPHLYTRYRGFKEQLEEMPAAELKNSETIEKYLGRE